MYRNCGISTDDDVFKYLREKEKEFINPSICYVCWRLFGKSEHRLGPFSQAKAEWLVEGLRDIGIAARVDYESKKESEDKYCCNCASICKPTGGRYTPHPDSICLNLYLSRQNYVTGEMYSPECKELNKDGNCQFFIKAIR